MSVNLEGIMFGWLIGTLCGAAAGFTLGYLFEPLNWFFPLEISRTASGMLFAPIVIIPLGLICAIIGNKILSIGDEE